MTMIDDLVGGVMGGAIAGVLAQRFGNRRTPEHSCWVRFPGERRWKRFLLHADGQVVRGRACRIGSSVMFMRPIDGVPADSITMLARPRRIRGLESLKFGTDTELLVRLRVRSFEPMQVALPSAALADLRRLVGPGV